MTAGTGNAVHDPRTTVEHDEPGRAGMGHPIVFFHPRGHRPELAASLAAEGWLISVHEVSGADMDGQIMDTLAAPHSPDRATLVGLGDAGRAVLEVADAHPERACAIVLIGTGHSVPDLVPPCPTLVLAADEGDDLVDTVRRFVSEVERDGASQLECPTALPALTPVLLNDPDVTRRLREIGAVHRVNVAGLATSWILTGHEASTSALADPSLLGAYELTAGFRLQPAETAAVHRGERDLVTIESSEHSRLRRLVGRYLTPARVETLRPRLQRETDALLDSLPWHEPVDLLKAFARPLPIVALCELCGVPEADRGYIYEWLIDRMTTVPPEAHPDIDEYFAKLIEARRRHPTDDLLGWVVEAEGDQLSEPDLISAVRLLMVGGHRAPTTLLANGIAALLVHRDQWRQLVADPAKVPAAVEELLRFVTPFPVGLARHVNTTMQVGGQHIPAGDLIAASLVAANRDPALFTEPDRLDITRTGNPHLAFGHGHHYCLGAALSRVETQIAIATLARRFPGMELDETTSLQYRSSRVRYLLQLPVVLQPAGSALATR